jgi:NADPH2:quinone reductase
MSQKALVVQSIGSPLVATERTIPKPGEGQVLVKITVAGLNPHDAKARKGGLFIQNTLPAPLAIDIVGTVQGLGPGVTGFSKGDKIFGLGNPTIPDQCGTQEFALLETLVTAKVPETINDQEAATLTLNPLTAFWVLFRQQALGIPPPAPIVGNDPTFDYSKVEIVIVGGGSACGKYAIAWSKWAGFGTIVTIASKGRNEQELLALGATHVIDRHGTDEEIEKQVRDIVGDDLVYTFDAVNAGQQQAIGARLLSNTKPSTLVTICGGDLDKSLLPKKPFEKKPIIAMPFSEPELAKSYWDTLPNLIVKGIHKPTPHQVIQGLDVEKVNQVLDEYSQGRAIIKPQIQVS